MRSTFQIHGMNHDVVLVEYCEADLIGCYSYFIMHVLGTRVNRNNFHVERGIATIYHGCE